MTAFPDQAVFVTDVTTPLGYATARALLDLQAGVRTAVRSRDEIPAGLEGADIQVGYPGYWPCPEDLEYPGAIFFSQPLGAATVEQAVILARAAHQRVERVFTASTGRYFGFGPSDRTRRIENVETVFSRFGFQRGWYLRVGALLMDDLAVFDGPTIRHTGRIANAYGDKPLAWVAAADVGAVLARAMVDDSVDWRGPERFGGAEQYSYPQVAALISDVVGRPVGYEEMTSDAWREELEARAMALYDAVDMADIETRIDDAEWTRRATPMAADDFVQTFTGRVPVRLADFVRARAEEFQPPA